MGISRATAYRWWARYQQLGEAGLVDRPSRPHHSPTRTAHRVEQRIISLRRRERLGPARIAARLRLPASTVYRVLVRHGLNRLAVLDRPTGRVIRRYEHPAPGDLVHLGVKKLGRIPPGGGHRAHGRATGTPRGRGIGYDYLHAAVDDHSRLAYVELLSDERDQTCAEFWRRAQVFFAAYGITARRVLTDNGNGYRSRAFARLRWRPRGWPTAGRVPTGPAPTARSSASTGPCWRSGPTGGCTGHKPPATAPCNPGSTPTTITAPTPPSAATHPSAASPTSRISTPRRPGHSALAALAGRSPRPRRTPGR